MFRVQTVLILASELNRYMALAVSKFYYSMLIEILSFIMSSYIVGERNTNLPADARRQVLHNQTVFRAHWRRIPAGNGTKIYFSEAGRMAWG